MNRQNNRIEKVEIPRISKEDLANELTQKAREQGYRQLLRNDGSAIIGAMFYSPTIPKNKSKRVNNCKLACCAEKRTPVHSLAGLAPSVSAFPERPEPEFSGWIRVEPRSVRRLKTRARFQKESYDRPSVLYAMTD